MLTRNDIRKGMTVRFTAENAFSMQIEQASQKLVPGSIYRITGIFEDRWGAYLYLEGISGKSYVCTMFEEAEGDPVVSLPPEEGKVRKVVAPSEESSA